MSLRTDQSIFAFNVHLLIKFAYDNGYELTFGEVLRMKAMQYLYFHGFDLRFIAGKLRLCKTNIRSKTMFSKHLSKKAVDFNLFKDGVYLTRTKDYQFLGEYWVSLHPKNRWGGDWDKDGDITDQKFHDGNHFEMV